MQYTLKGGQVAMKLFDKLKKSKSTITLEQILKEPYEQKYFNECKFIWKNFVPKSGQATVLQGELLREIEKLRCEAQDNGNANWDGDFSHFCDFIKDTLCGRNFYSEEEKAKIKLISEHLKGCGEYAQKLYNEKISDDEFDVMKIAYTDDNLYDILADAVGLWYSKEPKPVPFKPNVNIKR